MQAEQFRFGDWLVNPQANSLERGDERRQMEPRAMEVLVVLCHAAGQVVSADDLLSQCWRTGVYGDNPLHKTLTQLRRLLGDTATSPVYIETLRKRGYRTLAPVSFIPSGDEVRVWGDGSPFRGLHAFDEHYAPVFFGRDEATRCLVAAVASQVETGLALQLVLGPSGSGKSSLVRAGLFPALAPSRRPEGVAVLSTTVFDMAEQGEQPLFTALASAMLDFEHQDACVFPGQSAQSLGWMLEQGADNAVRQLRSVAAPLAQEGRQFLFALFIDHFEALFAPDRATDLERNGLLYVLECLARSGVVLLVIGCRNDFYPHIAQHPVLMAGKPNGAHFDLAPPSSADIAQIIRQPATAAGLRFGVDPHTGARLDDVLCESAARQPDVLPLLQYSLQELYRLRTADGELGFEAFRMVGGVEGAIAQRAEQVVAPFDEAHMAALARIMSLVVVIDTNEENVTGRRAPRAALRDDTERRVVDALVESRLFVSELQGQVPSFGIAHEAILRRWPRMREWIELHKGALLERARLAQLAARWSREGRSSDLLLPPGKQLEAARSLRDTGVFTLSEEELGFIGLSARRVRLRERLRLLAMSTIVLLALLAIGLGASAMSARQLAEQRRTEAEGLMGYMLGDFAERLRPLGKLDLLDGVSAKALEYLGASPDGETGTVALTQRARALQVIGEVRRARGDPRAAAAALGAANKILMRLHEAAPADTDVLSRLGVNAYWLGQLSKDQNDLDKAAAHWRMYQDFSDRLHRLEPDNAEWWVEQSYAHNNLGSLAATRGDAAGAARAFAQSIALKLRALDKAPESNMLAADLADSYSWLGSAKESLGELEEADRLYAQEMALVRRVRARAPGDALWIEREAMALQHRAANRRARGLDELAREDYRQASSQFRAITGQDKKNLNWQGDVATMELEEQYLRARDGGGPAALADMVRTHGRLEALLGADPQNVMSARREAMARVRLGTVLLQTRQVAAARGQAQAAMARLDALHAANPSNRSLRLGAANARLLMADVDRAAAAGQAAQAWCSQAAALIGGLAGASLDFQILDPWVRANRCLGKDALAREAAQRLGSIGYREVEYLRLLP